MNKQELKSELKKGITLEFSNEEDIFEVQFSKTSNKFMLRKNFELIKSTIGFESVWTSLPLHKLELTDKF